MALNDEIKQLLSDMAPDIPEEVGRKIGAAVKELKSSGLVERSLKKGDRLPLFTLPDLHGVRVSSIDLLEQGPLVISFYRGSW